MTEEPIVVDSDSDDAAAAAAGVEIANVSSGPSLSTVAARLKSRERLKKRKPEAECNARVKAEPSAAKKSRRPRKQTENAAPEAEEHKATRHEEDEEQVVDNSLRNPKQLQKRAAAAKKKRGRGAPKLEVAAPQDQKDEDEDEDVAQEPVNLEPEAEDEDNKDNASPELEPRKAIEKVLIHTEAVFCGKPIPEAQAKRRWPKRFDQNDDEECQSPEHYEEARVDGVCHKIGDCVSINGEGEVRHLGKIMEFFTSTTNENMFRVQWFYRLHETAIGELDRKLVKLHPDARNIYASEDEDDILLECIVNKITVCQIDPLNTFLEKTVTVPPSSDFYYSMCYRRHLSTFFKPPNTDDETSSCNDGVSLQSGSKADSEICSEQRSTSKVELSILDLYSGCGAMSTGLSMGGALAGASFMVKWTVDLNGPACDSLKQNHPEAEVHQMEAESFLLTLMEWQKLCAKYEQLPSEDENSGSDSDTSDADGQAYEVEKVVGCRMAGMDPDKKPPTSSKGSQTPAKWRLEFKVRWKGYSSESDTWEPVENLEDCQGRIRDFVVEGKRKGIFPQPGDVDVICGGPPCQGVSGFNRFRNEESPLECPRNRQMKIFMDIVEFLKPRFVLMENVVDILKFCKGELGRYALFRLVHMQYQAKLGLLTAGAYGLPQYRMRVFLWGASPSERLPPFPLPTHDVIRRGGVPTRFSANEVKHEDFVQLEEALLLEDAISDLPPVENSEARNEMKYEQEPKTSFQRYIRSAKEVFYNECKSKSKTNKLLHDHRPLRINADDYHRSCRIPKRKGANFRDLGGLRLKKDGSTIELDPTVQREYLPSGKPLIPDYAISFLGGKSLKPFARRWWDETVPTVVTRAEPHNHPMLHPVQDRVLTVRENARLQGFPDWYKLSGTVKERYTQVGNAVAVPVARALGYALGLSLTQGMDDPLLQLPKNFPRSL